MIIGVARGRETFQHLAARRDPGHEFVDELRIVPLQRDVEDGRHRKSRLLARDQRRIALDDAALLQRAHLRQQAEVDMPISSASC
ncbi:hypothetical protein BRDID11002_61540 [Bradyrhizobium diazoefficiens]